MIFSGSTNETRGTAFVVYEDIYDAKNACEHMSGFNVSNRWVSAVVLQPFQIFSLFRYLVVLYYQATKAYKRMDTEKVSIVHMSALLVPSLDHWMFFFLSERSLFSGEGTSGTSQGALRYRWRSHEAKDGLHAYSSEIDYTGLLANFGLILVFAVVIWCSFPQIN